MKWVIYFLLILNIGFAAWHFRGLDIPEKNTQEIEINHEKKLLLLSELESNGKDDKESGDKLCYSLGPFTKMYQSEKAQQILLDNNLETQRIRLDDTSRSGFWVTISTNGSRSEAKKHIERLKQLKVKDFFLVATGSRENSVSLGVYSSKALARRRIDDMIRLGFTPQMESVALPQKVYWLNWYTGANVQPPESVLDKLTKLYPQISKTERSCK